MMFGRRRFSHKTISYAVVPRYCFIEILHHCLGSSVVRGLLPRMVLLWRNSFPRSNKELESEKARGDAFTWQVGPIYCRIFS